MRTSQHVSDGFFAKAAVSPRRHYFRCNRDSRHVDDASLDFTSLAAAAGLVLGLLFSARAGASVAEDYWLDWYRIWIFVRLAHHWRAVEDKPQPHRQSPCHRPRGRPRR